MKKVLICFLANIFLVMPSFAIIEDFMLENLDPNLKVSKTIYRPIEDELVRKLDKNLKIQEKRYIPIVDENLPKEVLYAVDYYYSKNKNFNFENTDTTIIKIKPSKLYSTKDKLEIGKYLEFYLAEDVSINNKTYKKGTKIKARVENTSSNTMGGVPANLTIGNFIIDDEFINSNIETIGANRTLWVYPVGYIGCAFFGVGSLLFLIKGGHAKFKPAKTYEISY